MLEATFTRIPMILIQHLNMARSEIRDILCWRRHPGVRQRVAVCPAKNLKWSQLLRKFSESKLSNSMLGEKDKLKTLEMSWLWNLMVSEISEIMDVHKIFPRDLGSCQGYLFRGS